MASIKKSFSVQVDDGPVWEGGYAEFNRTSNPHIDLRHTSLYCPEEDRIWARIRWGGIVSKKTSLLHVPAGGLILPLQAVGCKVLEFPIEVLKRDFLLIMEKKYGGEIDGSLILQARMGRMLDSVPTSSPKKSLN